MHKNRKNWHFLQWMNVRILKLGQIDFFELRKYMFIADWKDLMGFLRKTGKKVIDD